MKMKQLITLFTLICMTPWNTNAASSKFRVRSVVKDTAFQATFPALNQDAHIGVTLHIPNTAPISELFTQMSKILDVPVNEIIMMNEPDVRFDSPNAKYPIACLEIMGRTFKIGKKYINDPAWVERLRSKQHPDVLVEYLSRSYPQGPSTSGATAPAKHPGTAGPSSTKKPQSLLSSHIIQFEGKLSSGHIATINYLTKPTHAELFEKFAADFGILPQDFTITFGNNRKVSYNPNDTTIPDISQATFSGKISFKNDSAAKKVVAALQDDNNRSNKDNASWSISTPSSSLYINQKKSVLPPDSIKFEIELWQGKIITIEFPTLPTYVELFENIADKLNIEPKYFDIKFYNISFGSERRVAYNPEDTTKLTHQSPNFKIKIAFKNDEKAKKALKYLAAVQKPSNSSESKERDETKAWG